MLKRWHRWGLVTPERPTMWLDGGPLSHLMSAWPQGETRGSGDWAPRGTIQSVVLTQGNPSKNSRHRSSDENPGWQSSVYSHILICQTVTYHWSWQLHVWTLPDCAICVSPCGWSWFVSLCYNKAVIISIVLSWVLWVILVNYQTWGGSGNPHIHSQRVRSEDGLWTPDLAAGVWGQRGVVEDCALNLWSLDQLWAVGIRSHYNAPQIFL